MFVYAQTDAQTDGWMGRKTGTPDKGQSEGTDGTNKTRWLVRSENPVVPSGLP